MIRKKSHKPPFFLLILISLAILAVYFYSAKNNPSDPQPQAKSLFTKPNKETIKIWASPAINSDLSARLNDYKQKSTQVNLQVLSDATQANVILTENPTLLPKGFISKTIFSQPLEIQPPEFQSLIPDAANSGFSLISAAKKETNNIQKLNQSLSESYKQKPPDTSTIYAVGDIMLSRHVGTKTREAGDTSYPFKQTYSQLKKADLTFANLESPFNDQGLPVTEGMVFKAEPDTISGLLLSGIDIVSLANNHFGNQGQKGMLYTFNLLKEKGISYTGAGANFTEAHTPLVKEVNGYKFAFLGYTDSDVYPSAAGPAKAGSTIMDIHQMQKDIASAKTQADTVIISMHSGTEYTPNPNERQKDFARAAIDAGADMIIGHHPHVVQAVEIYKGKLISYSLGNFVFDQMWSTETTQGITAKYTFMGNKLVKVEYQTVKIKNYAQPYFLGNSQESKDIFNRILQASNKLKEQ